MKLVVEMTPVELLSEFIRKREYHEAVAEARAWMNSDDAVGYAAGNVHRSGGHYLFIKRPGEPLTGVRKPSRAEETFWQELCAEINRRFAPKPLRGPRK